MARPHLHFTSLSPRELCGDIVESYRLAAQRLGYPTSYTDRALQPGAINVLFFFWDVPWETIAPYHPDCIVVNFEPMVPGTHAWRDNYLGVLKRCYLWEYSQSNFQRNRELGLHIADYVPLAWEDGAAPVLPAEDVLPEAERDIDVVFFGTLTQRRIDVLEALMRRGVRVVFTNGGRNWSQEERDGYLRRARLVLNFHNWDNSRVVEIGRLSILFRQRKAVVCELYPDSELEPGLREAVAGAPYDALVDTVIALLADPARRAALEQAGLPLLQRLPQTAHVGPALERFLQWRRQQEPPPRPAANGLRVAACAYVAQWNEAWATTFESLAAGFHPVTPIVAVPAGEADTVARALSAAGFADPRVLAVPAGIDAAAARNWAQHEAGQAADALLFCAAGQRSAHARVERLAALLGALPEVAIASHWVSTAPGATGGEAPARRTPELDHEIKAELFGPTPLALSHALVRVDFLNASGVRHDAELAASHQDLHFICKCAAAGARLAALPDVLLAQEADAAAGTPTDPVARAALAARARAPWLRAVFPHLTQAESALLGELYAHMWKPDAGFAQQLLATLSKACVHAPSAMGTERETLARIFRRDAVRLLTVFSRAGLVDQAWVDARFSEPAIARFLAPVSAELPLRPSPGPAARSQPIP